VPDVSFTNLLIVAAVAAAVPLALGWAPRLRVPSVVLEIVAGVLLGPSVLGRVEADLPVQVLAVLGLVVPGLKDAARAGDPVGQTTIAAASVADFAAIVLLCLLFSTSGGGAGTTAALLAGFGILVVLLALAAGRLRMSTRVGDVLVRLQDTTAEIRVRVVVLLLIAFVALAERLGLETILGGFLAGALVGLVGRDSSTHPRFRAELDAIGYGFLVPVFFVSSGVRLDLRGPAGGADGPPAGAGPPARPARRPRPAGGPVPPLDGTDGVARRRVAAGHLPAVPGHRRADRHGDPAGCPPRRRQRWCRQGCCRCWCSRPRPSPS